MWNLIPIGWRKIEDKVVLVVNAISGTFLFILLFYPPSLDHLKRKFFGKFLKEGIQFWQQRKFNFDWLKEDLREEEKQDFLREYPEFFHQFKGSGGRDVDINIHHFEYTFNGSFWIFFKKDTVSATLEI